MVRVQSYKYLGFEFHATSRLAHGVPKLVSAANKAMHAMYHRYTFLHITDPKQRCKLFDSLVVLLPILSYAREVWAVDNEMGESAEQLHRQFSKHVFGVGRNTATPMAAESAKFNQGQVYCQFLGTSPYLVHVFFLQSA